MGGHSRIKNKLLDLIGMSKPKINVRFSQAIFDKMDELINSGQYESKADIINQAVIEFLHRDGMRAVIREEIRKEKENQKSD